MAERDKVIKSGQLTIPRLLFLALVGGLIVAMVSFGGKALIIGYWVLTISICGLLFLIAIDFGVKMDKIDLTGQAAQAAATTAEGPTPASGSVRQTTPEPRQKRRSSRSKRRR